jgi:hypothetical protein
MRRIPIRFGGLLLALTVGGTPAIAQAPHDMPILTPMPTEAEARMARRFPQPVRVGFLIGLPLLDDRESTLGHVREVVRDPSGRIRLIVSYGGWLGGWLNWGGRPIALPIEAIGIYGRQIAALDITPQDIKATPRWTMGNDRPIAPDETIRIALARK